VRVDGPLAAYAESLVRIIERDFDAAHPGHRDRIDRRPSRRAATILDHHRHRTRRVLDVLADDGARNRVGGLCRAVRRPLGDPRPPRPRRGVRTPRSSRRRWYHRTRRDRLSTDRSGAGCRRAVSDYSPTTRSTARRRSPGNSGSERSVSSSPPPPRRKLFLRDGVSTDVKRDTLLAVALALPRGRRARRRRRRDARLGRQSRRRRVRRRRGRHAERRRWSGRSRFLPVARRRFCPRDAAAAVLRVPPRAAGAVSALRVPRRDRGDRLP